MSRSASPTALPRRRRLWATVAAFSVVAVALGAFSPGGTAFAEDPTTTTTTTAPTTTTTAPSTPPPTTPVYPLPGAQTSSYGYAVPPIVPLVVPTAVATDLILGGTAAGAGGASGGALGLCVTATAGGCLLSAAIFGGVFLGTTHVLNMWFPRQELEDPANLSQSIHQSQWKMCSADLGITAYNLLETLHPGSACQMISVAAYPRPGSTTGYSLRSCYLNGCPTTPAQAGSASYSYDTGSPGRCSQNASGSCTVTPGIAGDLVVASNIAWSRRSNFGPGLCAPYVYPACGIRPEHQGTLWTYPGFGDELARYPIDPGVAVHGYQRRFETTVRCEHIDNGQVQTIAKNSAWHFDDAPQELYPAILPSCLSTDWVRTKLTVKEKSLEPGLPTRTIIEINWPKEGCQIHCWTEIPKPCIRSPHTCDPQWDEDPETGTEVCRVMGIAVPVTAPDWICEQRERVAPFPQRTDQPEAPPSADPQPQPPDPEANPECPSGSCTEPQPSTTTTQPPTATTVASPPEGPDFFGPPVPDDEGEDDQGDCLPSGWGLLNPVDWVVKPLKCVLRWAFIPDEGLQTRIDRLWDGVEDSGVGTAAEGVSIFSEGVSSAVSAAGSAGCVGPQLSFTIDGEVRNYRPLDACSEPAKGYATWVRRIATVFVVLAGFMVIANALAAPFGHRFFGGGGDDDP